MTPEPATKTKAPAITKLHIKDFRCFEDLTIEGLGHVNLITGKNNTGKSSVLEALRLLASKGSLRTVQSILEAREEFSQESNDTALDHEFGSPFPLSTFFHEFPGLDSNLHMMIEVEGRGGVERVGFRVERVREVETMNGPRYERFEVSLKTGEVGVYALVIEIGRMPGYILTFRQLRQLLAGELEMRPEQRLLPFQFVSPFSGQRTSDLVSLWSDVGLTDQEADVEAALQLVEPRLQKVSMLANRWSQTGHVAMAKLTGVPRPVPLRSMGDGINRLFSLALSLVNARGGLLLIDEFENGLHHTVQPDAWKMIFALAARLNVQVFATTHSSDAIRAFAKAADDSSELEGVLVRLSRKGDRVLSTMFSEAELQVVAEEGIEVR